MRNYLLLPLLLFSLSCEEQVTKNHTLQKLEISYAVAETKTLWNKGLQKSNTITLNVLLISGSTELQELVKEDARLWTKYANIDFVFYTDPKALKGFDISVEISDEDLGNNVAGISHMGSNSRRYARKDKGSMTLWLLEKQSRAAKRGIILHEFGHALGLVHEHQHPDREFIYDEEKLISNCRLSFGWSETQCREYKLNPLYRNDLTVFQYDANSIMHYALHKDSLKYYQPDNLKMAKSLSLIDKLSIAKLYPGRVSAEKIIREHELLQEEILSTTDYKECRMSEFIDQISGLTFYYYQEKTRVYPPNHMFSGEAYKQDTILNMQADPACNAVTPTFDEAFSDL